MLTSFAMIDPETRAAMPMINAWGAGEISLALAVSLHLRQRGLIPQQDLAFKVETAKSEGLSDEEIVSNLLFEGVLWLKKQKDDLDGV